MKKFLTVLCLALLLTLVCATALAATIGSQYKYHGNTIDSLTTVNGKAVATTPDNKVTRSTILSCVHWMASPLPASRTALASTSARIAAR